MNILAIKSKTNLKRLKMKVSKKYRYVFFIVVGLVFCALLSAISDVIAILIVFFKIDRFIFSWSELLSNIINRAPVPGILLGSGLWLKNKLQERDNRGGDIK